MKKIFFYTILIVTSTITIFSCKNNTSIANKKDYNAFINPAFQQAQLQKNEMEIAFWNNKLKADTGSFVNMLEVGFNTLAHFKLSGNVNDLAYADSLFYGTIKKLNNKEASVYFALAQNAITQHKFNEAEQFIYEAEKIGADAATINLVRFDISMELGNYLGAELCLKNISKKEDNFDYLIRKAKFEDHLGNEKNTIANMEKAYDLVKNANKKSTINWVTTNLADMYSHANRLQDAYNMYVKALQLDSANLYALKGIATICFVNDKNTDEAERIFKFILSTTESPDLNLNLAEIAEYKGDKPAQDKYLKTFLGKIESNKKYGNMYNKYLVDVYLNEKLDIVKGLSIAQSEMNNRKTPETYSWLALANYKANNIATANEILNKYVLNKTKEPHALCIASIILSKTDKALSQKLADDCKNSYFELGPIRVTRLLQGGNI
jgi:lipopolysaccharide biosynthesis regulator YciM